MLRESPTAVLEDGRTVEREVCKLLDCYIGECLQYGRNNLPDWWSDDIVYLVISQVCSEKFKLLGVSWIGCEGIAPFEFIVELNPSNDDYFVKTVFRIGTLDEHGHPTIFNHRIPATCILESRPRYNRDWVMAVELTPRDARNEDAP